MSGAGSRYARIQFAPYDLGALGYLEEEFFVSGRAEALASDNTKVAGAQVSPVDSADYLTRLVVRRPIDPARFNGSVIVEWLNVSGGIDVEPDWALSHRHIIREGFAWVGASVQKAGIDGGGLMEGENHLKALFPERYQTLVHPGDSYSFDMYSQIGRLLRGGDVRSHPSCRTGSSAPGTRNGPPPSSGTSTTSTRSPASSTGSTCTAGVPGRPAGRLADPTPGRCRRRAVRRPDEWGADPNPSRRAGPGADSPE